jgi:hypothetical protein
MNWIEDAGPPEKLHDEQKEFGKSNFRWSDPHLVYTKRGENFYIATWIVWEDGRAGWHDRDEDYSIDGVTHYAPLEEPRSED